MTEQFPDLGWIPTFTFVRRPVPLPPDLRPLWKLLSVCLILLRCCRGQKAGLTKLHILAWCFKSAPAGRALLSFLDGAHRSEEVIVHVEPSLNRAIDFGVAEGLFKLATGKVALTDKGKQVARAIDNMDGVFEPEKQFLARVGHRLTDGAVKRLTEANI